MARTSSNLPLAGLRVLVCRPRDQAHALCRALETAGARIRSFPTIEIQPLELSPAQRSLVQDLDLYQAVIAVSANAAKGLIEAASHWWPQWPLGIEWLAVGRQTGALMRAAGLDCRYPEGGMTSEDLLERPELKDIRDQRLLLCKGRGGREILAQSLRERGARLDELVLYERALPRYRPDQIRDALTDFDPQVVVALSGETLNNLLALGENTDRALRGRAVLVPGKRVAAQAEAAGFGQILTPADLTPPAITAALAAWLGEDADGGTDTNQHSV